LATELDISTQAASERLRRGLDSLIDETLPREE
jgi:predicted DNA binding protein